VDKIVPDEADAATAVEEQSVGGVAVENRDTEGGEASSVEDSIAPAEPVLPTSSAGGQNDSVEAEKVVEQAQVVALRQPFDQAQSDKVIEKIVPAEVTEDDKNRIFHDRLAALSVKGNAARSRRLKDNHEKIIAYLKQHGYATNNEIEKLCNIGDSTATRYLKALERQGLVMHIGLKGKNLRWRLREAIT